MVFYFIPYQKEPISGFIYKSLITQQKKPHR